MLGSLDLDQVRCRDLRSKNTVSVQKQNNLLQISEEEKYFQIVSGTMERTIVLKCLGLHVVNFIETSKCTQWKTMQLQNSSSFAIYSWNGCLHKHDKQLSSLRLNRLLIF